MVELEKVEEKGEQVLATMLLVGKLVGVVVTIIKAGRLAKAQMDEIFAKYKDEPVTKEMIEKVRLELLDKAQISHAVDDPFIRSEIEKMGINPDELKIGD